MTLGHLGEAISAYLDGELSGPERHRADSHLAGCDLCRDELDGMAGIRARLRALPMIELPAELGGSSRAARPLYRRPRVLVGAVAAAMATVLALASLAAPDDVVTLAGDEFVSSFRARASLDQSYTSRLIAIEGLTTASPESGG
ncbi:MAG TPA: zf-HC2 domain-containing protein [Acidimicrobiia bacterium]|jgi:anti-sigma factor RsiW|nr:zf-HC2 domain-containing protein [Acidimicrobiia bacterium]